MAARKETRPFGPTNEPETCLYCGTKLRYSTTGGYSWSSTVSLCCQARVDQRMERQPGIGGWRQARFCTVCGRELVGDAEDTELKTTTVPERRSELPGYGGYFCTRDCGYRFGRLAAEQGVRYVTRPVPAHEEAGPSREE